MRVARVSASGNDRIRKTDRPNSIVTSFNRNFAKRNDGNPNTHAFVASPELVAALTIAGDLCFNPLVDTLENDQGERVKLAEPIGYEIPPRGYEVKNLGYVAPSPMAVAWKYISIQILNDYKNLNLSRHGMGKILSICRYLSK